MEISIPIFMIAYKDKITNENMIKKYLALQILSEIIMGSSSKLYKRLYEQGLISSELEFDYEFARDYAHCIIQGTSNDPEKVIEELKNEINFYKNQGISDADFERQKKKLYGEFVKDYNDVSTIGHMVISDCFKNLNSFMYFEEFDCLTKKDLEEVLNTVFDENVTITVKKKKEDYNEILNQKEEQKFKILEMKIEKEDYIEV